MCAIGAVLDGEVHAGMTARLEVAVGSFEHLVEAVELACGASGAHPVLVFRYPTHAAAVLARDSLAEGSVLECGNAV